MYPAQTSFIPAQIALAGFLENQGWRTVFANYPYWYLGTTPFRYLTGPILPSVLVFFHRLVPNFSLFEVMFFLIAVSWVLGAGGVYLLVVSLANSSTSEESLWATVRGASLARFSGFLAALFYFFGPIVPFLFRFSGGLNLIAFSFLPYVLLLYAKFLRREKRKGEVLLFLAVAFIILLDSSIIPTLLLGMLSIFLATTGWRGAEERVKQTFQILIFALLISTLWYSPGYWWQLLIAPSFAGKPLFRVLGDLAQLLPISLAIGLAIVSGRVIELKGRVLRFCFYWLFIYGFLTLMRFISDPDFWLDWSAYAIELQLGLAILGGLVMNHLVLSRMQTNAVASGSLKRMLTNERMIILAGVMVLVVVSWGWVFKRYVLGTLQRDISQGVEYRIGKVLSETISPADSSTSAFPNLPEENLRGFLGSNLEGWGIGQVFPAEKVFLSGTTAFWLNSFFDIPQVRGGVDQVSVHPTWRKAVWEIREGTDPEKSTKWLRDLGISYLVVHTEDSEEFYHDFRNPEKFENISELEKIYDYEGDRIYRVR